MLVSHLVTKNNQHYLYYTCSGQQDDSGDNDCEY